MRFSVSAVVAALTGFLDVCTAHNIQMRAHSRECFHEQLHKGDRMTVSFQVGDREFGGSGNLEIDFWVGLSSGLKLGMADMLHLKTLDWNAYWSLTL